MSRPDSRCSPKPSSTGLIATCIASTRSAARYCRIVEAPHTRQHVVFDCFPREAKAAIEKRLAGVPRLELCRPRPVSWVEENRSNPFREWADEDARLGKAATAAWKNARAAVRRLGPNVARADARKVLETSVAVFNRYEASIDTIGREQACDAFHELARGLGVPEDRTQDWLDE